MRIPSKENRKRLIEAARKIHKEIELKRIKEVHSIFEYECERLREIEEFEK